MSCDFISLANEGVQGLQPYQPGKPIEELERELGLTDIVKLASNENPLGPPPEAVKAYKKAASSLHLYPDGGGFELKARLAEALEVEACQITLGNGSNDILDLIGHIFLDTDSSAVYSQHAFIVYQIAVQAAGAKPMVIPAKDWGHDLDAMAEAVDGSTRVVFIANPNNPTGTWLGRDAMIGFLKKIPEDVIVVLDEAYCEYVEEADYPDGVTLLQDFPNLIVTRTFSKAYGLAGLRVGYSVSHPDVADLLNRLRAPFNVSIPAQVAALAAFDDVEYLRESLETNRAGMRQLSEGLVALGLEVIPSVGNFIAVEMPGPALPYYQGLLERGIIVRPVGGYEMPNHLRISVGLKHENQRCLDALKDLLSL
jgi:histidinol-phosphate aminotransferase